MVDVLLEVWLHAQKVAFNEGPKTICSLAHMSEQIVKKLNRVLVPRFDIFENQVVIVRKIAGYVLDLVVAVNADEDLRILPALDCIGKAIRRIEKPENGKNSS